MVVIKSDGTKEEFCLDKVKNGICEAYISANEECQDTLIEAVANSLFVYENISTNEIRRQIEECLMSINKKVAKKYIAKKEEINNGDKELKKKNDFIRDYINASNAASGSKFDANANVENKNVVTMGQELYKGDNIKQNRYIMHNKIKSLYTKKLADQYIADLESHILYKHDESGIPGMPYTYSAKEVVEVLYNEKHLMLPFDLLWDVIEEDEVLVNENDNVYQKYPSNLKVKDIDGFTSVTVMTKKERKRDLVRIKTSYGEDVVVTDNHPMIVDKSNVDVTVQAIDSYGEKQYKINDVLVFDGKTNIDTSISPNIEHYTETYCMSFGGKAFKRHINLNEDFGYFVGFFVGDGNYNNNKNNGSIVITQKDINVLYKLNDILFREVGICGNIRYKRDKHKCYTLTISSDVLWWLLDDFFMIQDKSQNKTLPCNILETNEDFAKGVLEGLIDSDGTVNDCQLSIRLSSRSAIIQTTNLLRHFNYGVGNVVQNLPFRDSEIKTNYTLWGVNCSVRNDSVKLEKSFKLKNVRVCESGLKYSKHGETKITNVEKINENDAFLSLNDFIYDITTETHTFASNNLWVHNCVAITMYPFLIDGLTKLGGQSKAPTDLKSYCGEFINLVYSVSSQFMGAVATPEFLLYFDYFARQDYGDDYIEHIDDVVEFTRKKRTLGQVIDNYFQQVVHSMNMPAGNRGYQTVFWNVGYFDEPYFEGVFGEFMFPDGTKPKWESLSWLQKRFMNWFNDEREKYVLTFPVETMAMLTDGADDFLDKDYADFTAEMWSKGHSFFCYLSDSPDSLSSCCFSKNQKVLWKSSTLGVKLTTFEELHSTKLENDKDNLRIFHNGSWVEGKSIKLPNREMFKVKTYNNKEFVMTDNHINVTLDGEKETKDLKVGDYLMFNTQKLCAIPENDEHLTYEEGFAVGAFLGDGSFGSSINDGVYDIIFSQNANKYEETMRYVNEANRQLGGGSKCKLNEIYNNVYPLRISSRNLASFIMRWTNWERGTYAHNKKLNLNCLLQSEEFRRGILDGWYNTDGGNSNICYTTSKELAEDMEVLITSLGMQSIIDVSDRTEETLVIREKEYDRHYPLYCVRWYSEANHRSNKDFARSWIKKNNSIFFKIMSIEKEDYSDDVYCIECSNANEPYFTLPCGLITHNCRLRNSLKDSEDTEHNHTTHQYSMGTASVATGSKSVMTINLPRLIQDATRQYLKEKLNIELEYGKNLEGIEYDKTILYEYIKNAVVAMTERIHKYQRAFNEITKDFFNAKMLDVYSAGFIDLRKQYLTVGVNGITDAAEFLGLKVSVNDEYKEFVNEILETINMCNRRDKTRDCMYNTEFIPAENVAVKHYNWDKNDGYWVSPNRNLYSSYFYNPEDESISVLDKMTLHGRDYVKYLDGGSAYHCNLSEHLSQPQYRQMLKNAARSGCNYFTFNVKNSVCNDCGFISKHTIDECPHCKSNNIDYLTRVIGYLKRVSSFSEQRQIEEGKRYYA